MRPRCRIRFLLKPGALDIKENDLLVFRLVICSTSGSKLKKKKTRKFDKLSNGIKDHHFRMFDVGCDVIVRRLSDKKTAFTIYFTVGKFIIQGFVYVEQKFRTWLLTKT